MTAVGQSAALASLRDLRARVRAGLLEEAVQTMQDLGCQVARVAATADVVTNVLTIVPAGANVVYQPCVVGQAARLEDALRAKGRHVVTLPRDGQAPGQNGSWREHLLAAQFGITGATTVVADTGSLVLAEELGFARAASNIPPVHIALVSADRVVGDLLDAGVVARAYAALHLGRPVPRYLSLIGGPSRTADIGLTLVRGMHGPRAVHVIIWDPPTSPDASEDALRKWVLA